jgi:hypothetical protein
MSEPLPFTRRQRFAIQIINVRSQKRLTLHTSDKPSPTATIADGHTSPSRDFIIVDNATS